MKKILLLGFCFLSMPTFAYTSCVGGYEITANRYGVVDGVNQDKGGACLADGSNCNGKTFCMSREGMTWWSAWTWCQSNGGTLAHFETMCPGHATSPEFEDGACPNLYKVRNDGTVWSALVYSGNAGLIVPLSSGRVQYRYKDGALSAFCE